MSNERVVQLARKLKALADRGVGGKKENAVTMLKGLMKKHGITLEMINGVEISEFEFFIEPDRKKFFIQVAASVLGNGFRCSSLRGDRKKKKSVFFKCTHSERIEIQAKYEFFYKIWEVELDVFYSAFVQKQRLFAKPKEDEEKEDKPLSPEEKAKIYKMFQMMEGMDRHHFTKQLNYKQ